MEAVIGFAVGYWVGTRQGRQGLERAVDAARDIAASPETKRLLGEGVAAAAPLAELLGKRRGGTGRSAGIAVIRGVLDELADRRLTQSRAA